MRSKLIFKVKFIWLLSGLLFFSTSCARYTVIDDNSLPITDDHGNDGEAVSANLQVYFWGLFSSPELNTNKCSNGGFNQVKVKSNAFQTLVSIITIGIVRPMTVEYKCAKFNDNN
jgi:hypothetical protein